MESRRRRRTTQLIAHAVLGAAAAAVVLTAEPKSVRADWYSDVADIIQQLIEDEIAQRVVPNLAVEVPSLCRHFPLSIAALQGLRFSGLPAIFRAEVADAVGLALYSTLEDVELPVLLSEAVYRDADGDPKLRKADEKRKRGKQPRADDDFCKKARPKDATGTADFSLLDDSIGSRTMRSCARQQASVKLEATCAVSLVVRDAILGEYDQVSDGVRRLSFAMFYFLAAELQNVRPFATNDPDLERAFNLFVEALSTRKLDDALAAEIAELLVANGVVDPALTQVRDELKKYLLRVRSARSDVTTLVGALDTAGTLAGIYCTISNTAHNDVCKKISTFLSATGDDGKLLRRMLAMAERRDYGGVAGLIADRVGAEYDCEEDDLRSICSDRGRAALRFVRTLAVYAVDSITHGSTSEDASSDFRRAAVDLIQYSSGPGIWRTYFEDCGDFWSYLHCWKKTFFMPRFALRAAAWEARGEGEIVEYPSIDSAHFRRGWVRKPYFYFATDLSLLDLLGPFSETATRRDELDRNQLSGWDWVLPLFTFRLDLEFAAPALSKHLLVGGGAAFRFYQVVEPAMVGGDYGYCVWGDDGCEPDMDNIEFSLFVKYMP